MAIQYSIQKMLSDGTLSTVVLGIEYLQRNDLYMRIAGEETPQSGGSTYTWYFQDNTTLKINPVVPKGVEVVVYRRTDTDTMYNIFSQNAQFDEATIDENNQQLLFIAQEYLEQGIPGAGIQAVEQVSEDDFNLYYRVLRTDGSYTDNFPIPKSTVGYPRVGDFTTGCTVTARNQAVLEVGGSAYVWTGALDKVVPPNSTPASTGGISPAGDWVDIGDASLRSALTMPDGFGLIGQYESIESIRSKEPSIDGQKILVSSHTAGYKYGGGEFYAVIDGSPYTDNNGTVIKTNKGSAWIRKQNHYTYAVDFGFIPDDSTKAATNTSAIQAAAAWAYANGTDVWLPMGEKHINSTSINVPVSIKGNTTIFGAALVERTQKSDVVHHGGGFAFDFTPMVRPTVPSSSQVVSDGPALIGLSIRGNDTDAAGAWRVNNSNVIGNEAYARRNFTAMNVQVSGYHAGYGFQMFWMFTNRLHNVVVWDCAVPWYMRSCYANDHFGCVYENCSYGVLAINCYANNHFGGAIEGIRGQSRHTKPSDYDENGGSPLSYDGIGVRCRGGNFFATGTYFEANRIHFQVENAGKLSVHNCYQDNTSTDIITHGISGEFRQTHCIISGNPTVGTWVQASSVLKCSYAEIHSNNFISMTKPASIPNIANVGEFDVYDGSISDSNGSKRVRLGQEFQTGGYQANNGAPRETYSEIFTTRPTNAGASSVTRTVDIGSLVTATGHVTALQASGVLTFTNTNTAFAKDGRDLLFIINASGTCSVNFDSSFRLPVSSSISLVSGQTATLQFRSQGGKFYQIGATNIMTT